MAAVMAETTEARIMRLESDVAHIRSDVSDLRTDVRELRKDFGGLRKEFGDLRLEFGDLRGELTRGLLQTRIWMLLLCAAILGVMGRGFHWF